MCLGDLPLRDDVRWRLRRTKAKLVEILYTNSELLDHLLSMNVINETDHQSVLAEFTTNQRNARLIDILLRGSERSLKCFGDALKLVHQGYVVEYLEKGTKFLLNFFCYFSLNVLNLSACIILCFSVCIILCFSVCCLLQHFTLSYRIVPCTNLAGCKYGNQKFIMH